MNTYIVQIKEIRNFLTRAGLFGFREKENNESRIIEVEIKASSFDEARAIVENQIQLMKAFKICIVTGYVIGDNGYTLSVKHEIMSIKEKETTNGTV